MYTITKEFAFSASHQLDFLPEDHQCARMHGHNYVVTLELSCGDSARTEPGFVRDYGDLGDFKRWIDDTVDHRHLYDGGKGANPAAENLARWIFDAWTGRYPELTAVRVSETPKTWATYRAG